MTNSKGEKGRAAAAHRGKHGGESRRRGEVGSGSSASGKKLGSAASSKEEEEAELRALPFLAAVRVEDIEEAEAIVLA